MPEPTKPPSRAPKQRYAIGDTFLDRHVDIPTAAEKARFYFDDQTRGFGVKVYASGTIVFGVRFNLPAGKMRWVVIGTYKDDYKTKAAREEAIVIKQNVGKGFPPLVHRVKPETALARLQDLAEKWFAELDELVLSKNLSEKTVKKYKRQWIQNVPKSLKFKYVSELDVTDFQVVHRKITKSAVRKKRVRKKDSNKRVHSKKSAQVTKKPAPKKGRPIEANRTLNMLSSMLGWVMGLPQKKRMGLTENHALAVIKNPERIDRGVQLKDAEQIRLIQFLHDPMNRHSVWWEVERKALKTAKTLRQKREDVRQPAHVLEDKMADALLICFLTGLRSWEVKAMRWDGISEEGDMLKTPVTKQGARKTTRLIYKDTFLTDDALEVLGRQPRESEWVFPSRGRSKKSTSGHITNLQDAWERVRSHLGLPIVRIHDLRHTMACELARPGGLGVKDLQAAMGWESSQTALRYLHAYEENLKESIRAITDKRKARLAQVQANNEVKPDQEGVTVASSRAVLPQPKKTLQPIDGLSRGSKERISRRAG
jgi:integrase